jgi:preprotein translocase subunit SecD
MKISYLILVLILSIVFAGQPAHASKKSKKSAKVTQSAVSVFEVKDGNSVILKTSDVSEASAIISGKGDQARSAILIELNATAVKKFDAYIKRNIGKSLTFLIDGKVISSHRITDETDEGRMTVDPMVSSDETDAIIERINHQSKKK